MKAKTEQPLKLKRLDNEGNEIASPKKPTELIELAQADGVFTAEEYTVWLKGYNACMDKVLKDIK